MKPAKFEIYHNRKLIGQVAWHNERFTLDRYCRKYFGRDRVRLLENCQFLLDETLAGSCAWSWNGYDYVTEIKR